MSDHGNLFAPLGNTTEISATSTSSTTAITQHPNPGGGTVMVANEGTNTVHIKFGNSGVTATVATAMPVLAGVQRVFSIGKSTTHVAAICAATETATFWVTPGRGL